MARLWAIQSIMNGPSFCPATRQADWRARKCGGHQIDKAGIFHQIGLAHDPVHFGAGKDNAHRPAKGCGPHVGRRHSADANLTPDAIFGKVRRSRRPTAQPTAFVAPYGDMIGVRCGRALPQAPGIGLDPLKRDQSTRCADSPVEHRAFGSG